MEVEVANNSAFKQKELSGRAEKIACFEFQVGKVIPVISGLFCIISGASALITDREKGRRFFFGEPNFKDHLPPISWIKASMDMAGSVMVLTVPREPSSVVILKIAFSSFTRRMVRKS